MIAGIIDHETKDEITFQMTPDGANYFATLFTPRKIVITMLPSRMEALRKLKPGEITDFVTIIGKSDTMRKVKVMRRDWKRGKVHLLEIAQ